MDNKVLARLSISQKYLTQNRILDCCYQQALLTVTTDVCDTMIILPNS